MMLEYLEYHLTKRYNWYVHSAYHNGELCVLVNDSNRMNAIITQTGNTLSVVFKQSTTDRDARHRALLPDDERYIGGYLAAAFDLLEMGN